ncbi:hypothetical protein EYF80_003972 [Liparis tanakae]|uniref:Uncharacterized protein n=1 Tax=Liparis tanakae TaxID=230148 RepID=A0A4Z2J5R5_9TELE|nr:hypothetical protein EYF80_003972 [Liparis tanakae]
MGRFGQVINDVLSVGSAVKNAVDVKKRRGLYVVVKNAVAVNKRRGLCVVVKNAVAVNKRRGLCVVVKNAPSDSTKASVSSVSADVLRDFVVALLCLWQNNTILCDWTGGGCSGTGHSRQRSVIRHFIELHSLPSSNRHGLEPEVPVPNPPTLDHSDLCDFISGACNSTLCNCFFLQECII